MARPSVHQPLSISYAIDQLTDPEDLRRVAHAMWNGLTAAREQAEHLADNRDGRIFCGPCQAAFDGDGGDKPGCDDERAWQNAIEAAYNAL